MARLNLRIAFIFTAAVFTICASGSLFSTGSALPDPCASDPILGTWKAKIWRDNNRIEEVTIKIEAHRPNGSLAGRFWLLAYSPDLNPRSPPSVCRDPQIVVRYHLNGEGTLQRSQFSFQTDRVNRIDKICTDDKSFTGEYAPDRFQGIFYASEKKLKLVWDDDKYVFGRPVEFRRESCP